MDFFGLKSSFLFSNDFFVNLKIRLRTNEILRWRCVEEWKGSYSRINQKRREREKREERRDVRFSVRMFESSKEEGSRSAAWMSIPHRQTLQPLLLVACCLIFDLFIHARIQIIVDSNRRSSHACIATMQKGGTHKNCHSLLGKANGILQFSIIILRNSNRKMENSR